MNKIETKKYPSIRAMEGLSERAQLEHYKLYEGYVRKFNQLAELFAARQAATGLLASADLQSLKVDLTYALGAIKNHELFFDVLGGGGEGPSGDLADAIKKDFCSVPAYLVDLKQTALSSRGWAWTAYDLDQKFIFNYGGSTQHALPVWNSIPILTIDMYGHAYLYDYGNNKAAYIETVLSNLDWQRIAGRWAKARRVGAGGA